MLCFTSLHRQFLIYYVSANAEDWAHWFKEGGRNYWEARGPQLHWSHPVVWFAELKNPSHRNEGRVHGPLLSNTSSTPGRGQNKRHSSVPPRIFPPSLTRVSVASHESRCYIWISFLLQVLHRIRWEICALTAIGIKEKPNKICNLKPRFYIHAVGRVAGFICKHMDGKQMAAPTTLA